jgi:hypothetical protein
MGIKLKAADEHSTNANTIRPMKRRAKMTEVQKQIDKAKAADQAAVTEGYRKLRLEPKWKAAVARGDMGAKKSLQKESRDAILNRRYA